MIRGWANSHRTGTAKEPLSKLDTGMVRSVQQTHPTKPKEWTQSRYWGRLNLDRNDHWVFGNTHTGAYLLKVSWFPSERHILVKGRASPDEPALKDDWKERQAAKAKDLLPRKQKLAQRQHGVGPSGKQSLFKEEDLHAHHRHPRKQGGKDTYGHLQGVHLFCHQRIHAKVGTKEPAQLCRQKAEKAWGDT